LADITRRRGPVAGLASPLGLASSLAGGAPESSSGGSVEPLASSALASGAEEDGDVAGDDECPHAPNASAATVTSVTHESHESDETRVAPPIVDDPIRPSV
jgi:hypothetical protein